MRKLQLQAKLAVIFLVLQAPGAMQEAYNLITGYLCIKSDFIETAPGPSTSPICALRCSLNQRCQAFSLADGPCQLFVFDKCSKPVRDCSCSRRGQVFVKQQTGLKAGSLCPSGYGDDLCGVKYKVHSVVSPAYITWYQGKVKCESDGGLSMMSSVTSKSENQHVQFLYNKYMASIDYMYLGGFQAPGSVEPAGGWSWLPCNIAVNATFWTAGEPGNEINRDNTIGQSGSGIGDYWDTGDVKMRGMLCECLSPFD